MNATYIEKEAAMQATGTTIDVLGPAEGQYAQIGAMGVRFMVDPDRGGGFSLVEHPIAPRSLAAPLHTHTHEDEYSYVLEGQVGVQIGEEVAVAGPGELVFKPRGIKHAFWNAGDTPARLLEIITPAPFSKYFEELEPLMAGPQGPDFPAIAELQARYGLTMDPAEIEPLIEREGLLPMGPPPDAA
jgi:quercetin dioxygenase-like cupin family protein